MTRTRKVTAPFDGSAVPLVVIVRLRVSVAQSVLFALTLRGLTNVTSGVLETNDQPSLGNAIMILLPPGTRPVVVKDTVASVDTAGVSTEVSHVSLP